METTKRQYNGPSINASAYVMVLYAAALAEVETAVAQLPREPQDAYLNALVVAGASREQSLQQVLARGTQATA